MYCNNTTCKISTLVLRGVQVNKKNNQRSRLTKMLMKQAYLRLMRQRQPGQITVKEICEGAEINRSSFYLHYTEPNDILKELEDEAIGQISEYLLSIGSSKDSAPDAKNYLMSFLRYIRNNDELFRTLLVKNSDPHFRRKLSEFALTMTESSFYVSIDEEKKTYIYKFIISGCLELLSDWIQTDYVLADQKMCSMLYSLCEGSIRFAMV